MVFISWYRKGVSQKTLVVTIEEIFFIDVCMRHCLRTLNLNNKELVMSNQKTQLWISKFRISMALASPLEKQVFFVRLNQTFSRNPSIRLPLTLYRPENLKCAGAECVTGQGRRMAVWLAQGQESAWLKYGWLSRRGQLGRFRVLSGRLMKSG